MGFTVNHAQVQFQGLYCAVPMCHNTGMETTPAPSSIPGHIKAVVNDDLAYFESLDLTLAARQRVLQVCSVSASATSAAWVDLIQSWGFDLDASTLVASEQRSQSWLWYALARGKIAQAIALVKAGARRMDVDEQGTSGLGRFIKDNVPFSVDRVLPVLKSLEAYGLGWQNWPDADEMNNHTIKMMGASLGDLVARHDANLIAISTPLTAQDALPVRL